MYDVVAAGGVSDNYDISYTKGVLTVTAADLTITAENKSREVGLANPAFTFSYNGFVAGDDASDLLTLPSAICAASELSPVGDYSITPTGATSNNYNISVVNGTLTVSLSTGVDKLGFSTVQIAPNPSTGLFYIQGVEDGALLSIEVRDITGNVVITTSEKVVDLTSKANGVYLLSVNIDGSTKVYKVIKK